MEALPEYAYFLESVSDDVLDSRLAVKQLERLGWHLQQLTPEEQQDIVDFAVSLAESCEKKHGTEDGYGRFLRRFPHDFRLLESNADTGD